MGCQGFLTPVEGQRCRKRGQPLSAPVAVMARSGMAGQQRQQQANTREQDKDFARKRHININSFVRLALDATGYDPNGHLQESPGRPGPKSPKSLKKVSPGLPARSVQKESKSLKKVSEKSLFDTFLRHFDSTLFETFWTLRAGRPGETFLRLFGDFGPGGPRDSCKWPSGSQARFVQGQAQFFPGTNRGRRIRIASRELLAI